MARPGMQAAPGLSDVPLRPARLECPEEGGSDSSQGVRADWRQRVPGTHPLLCPLPPPPTASTVPAFILFWSAKGLNEHPSRRQGK